jgi:hypothetical protein
MKSLDNVVDVLEKYTANLRPGWGIRDVEAPFVLRDVVDAVLLIAKELRKKDKKTSKKK